MREDILHITNLSKSYSGVKALDNVQIFVKKGEVHALMGENGAGKSTFMKILAGLVIPDSGEIILDGEVLKNTITIFEKGRWMPLLFLYHYANDFCLTKFDF